MVLNSLIFLHFLLRVVWMLIFENLMGTYTLFGTIGRDFF